MDKYIGAKNDSPNNSIVEKAEADKELLQKLEELVSNYPDYITPYMRSDGDIIISLNPTIKRKIKTTQNFSEAIKFMMNENSFKGTRK